MKSYTAAILAGAVAYVSAQEAPDLGELSECGQGCVTRMQSIATNDFGCSESDVECQCSNANFANGLRDCGNEACEAESQFIIQFGLDYCAGIEGSTGDAGTDSEDEGDVVVVAPGEEEETTTVESTDTVTATDTVSEEETATDTVVVATTGEEAEPTDDVDPEDVEVEDEEDGVSIDVEDEDAEEEPEEEPEEEDGAEDDLDPEDVDVEDEDEGVSIDIEDEDADEEDDPDSAANLKVALPMVGAAAFAAVALL